MTAIPKPPPPWALEAVYPGALGSTAWAAMPCKVRPAGDLWAPNTKLPADNANWLDNSITVEAGLANDRDIAAATGNWSPLLTAANVSGGGSGADNFFGLEWDDYYKRWISLPQGHTGTWFNAVSYDGGLTWESWGSFTGIVGTVLYAFGINAANGDVVAPAPFSGPAVLYIPGATGVGVLATTSALGTSPGGKAIFFAGTWYVFTFTQSGGSFTGFLATSSSPATAWTNSTSSLPSAFQSGTNHIQNWAVSASSAAMVLALKGATAGTDTAHLAAFTGGAWADVTPSLLTSKIVTGLHYSVTDNLFGLLVWDGTSSYLYTSATPSTSTSWVLCKTFTAVKCSGLSTLGRVWVTTGKATSYPTTTRRMFVSNDVASAGAASTWRPAPFSGVDGGGAIVPDYAAAAIRSSGTQLGVFCDAGFKVGRVCALTDTNSAY